MGAEDVRRQALKVFHMKMLGATVRLFSFNSKLELYLHPFTLKVVSVESGSKTLKDAVNEAMRDWVTNPASTHDLIGSCFGPPSSRPSSETTRKPSDVAVRSRRR